MTKSTAFGVMRQLLLFIQVRDYSIIAIQFTLVAVVVTRWVISTGRQMFPNYTAQALRAENVTVHALNVLEFRCL